MQNKGLIRFLAVLLALVCAFYLSFSFVTRHYDKQAEIEADGNEIIQKHYLDSLNNQKVWFGYTLKECREKEVNFGLDLKGGMSVTLEVSVPEILNSLSKHNTSESYLNAIELAKEKQKSSQKDFLTLFVESYEEIVPGGQLNSIFLATDLNDKISSSSTNTEVKNILAEEIESALKTSQNVLTKRIDNLGVVQPNIQRVKGESRFVIELPGIKEKERVEKLLQGAANLEFWETYELSEILDSLVSAERTIQNILAAEQTQETTGDTQLDTLKNASKEHKTLFSLLHPAVDQAGNVARGPVVGYALGEDTAAIMSMLNIPEVKESLPSPLKLAWTFKPDDNTKHYQLIALKPKDGGAALEGDVVTNASPEFSQYKGVTVNMVMNSKGAKDWKNLTGQNKGRSVAIVLDGYVYSFPTVQAEIAGGRSEITGNFTIEEANDLANTLKSGKMCAPARIMKEDVVGPSLGKEAIQAGMISFIIAFCLILLYMVLYYGLIPGLIADAALLCNVFLLLGILTSFGSVLTLPGMAGIVLTMGMAVDANVLIYERIREEIIAGKNIRKAIEDGFSGAVSAIIDSNVTSFLTGVVLAIFGSGPIRGFAITYMIGIISSFLTAVFLTRLMLDDYAKRDTAKPLAFTTKITAKWFRNTHVKFIKLKKISYIVACCVILISALGLVPSFFGRLNFGIDFTGGSNYIVRFEQTIPLEDVKAKLNDIFKENAKDGENCTVNVITFGEENQIRVSTNYGINDNSKEVGEKIQAMLFEGLKDYLPEGITAEQFSEMDETIGIVQSQKVDATIANEILGHAVWAILAALLIIFLYILLRFRDFAYSVGAIVALVHDALVILGLYALLWPIMPFSMEIDQAFIAAILTIIGYSINDTVVVFDRIRENTKLYPTRSLMENMDNSVNQTLSRTFSTSLSTLLVLLAIFCFGGESIRGFVFALLMGVVVGTFSTTFIASPIAHDIKMWEAKRKAKKATKAAAKAAAKAKK